MFGVVRAGEPTRKLTALAYHTIVEVVTVASRRHRARNDSWSSPMGGDDAASFRRWCYGGGMAAHPPPSGAPVDTVPVLPLRNSVLFPMSVVPINVGRPRSVRLVEDLLGR